MSEIEKLGRLLIALGEVKQKTEQLISENERLRRELEELKTINRLLEREK